MPRTPGGGLVGHAGPWGPRRQSDGVTPMLRASRMDASAAPTTSKEAAIPANKLYGTEVAVDVKGGTR